MRRNAGDDDVRRLERRVAEGDEAALVPLMAALRRREDPRWVELWVGSKITDARQLDLEPVRLIVRAVVRKPKVPWAWLYVMPLEPDEEREGEEELEWLVESTTKSKPPWSQEPRPPTGRHDRWVFALAVRQEDGSVTLGVGERTVPTYMRVYGGALDRSLFDLSRLWPELSRSRGKSHVGREEYVELRRGGERIHAYEGGWKRDLDRNGNDLPDDAPGSTLSQFRTWASKPGEDRIVLSPSEALVFSRKQTKNPGDEDLRSLERRVAAGDRSARGKLIREKRKRGIATHPWSGARSLYTRAQRIARRFERIPEDYLEEFTRSHAETALWSTTESDEDGNQGEALDANYTIDDLSPETESGLRADCTAFVTNNWENLLSSGLSASQAGHDFWLTRNGHGAGFWDEGLGDVGDDLSDAAEPFGSVDLYVGDDGLIHGGFEA